MYLNSKYIADLIPYTAGLTTEYVSAKYNFPPDEISKLGSAENPFGPSPKALDAITRALSTISIYPEWSAQILREAIAKRYGFDPENVACGAGASEIMSFIIRAFSSTGDKLLMYEPCFPLYYKLAAAEGRIPVFQLMGKTFDFHLDELLSKITPDIRVVFLTSPHSPTGRMLAEAEVCRICEAAGGAIVVLDEAYVHFSETEGHIHLAKKYPNLIVLRTFSKVFGLGGLRIGFGVCQAEVARILMRIKPPWNLGRLQVAGATAALSDDDHVNKTIAMVSQMRDYVIDGVRKLKHFRVIEGTRANFFLLRVPEGANSTDIWRSLLKKGVIVKDCNIDFRGLERGYLRIDIAPKRDMDRLIDALNELDIAKWPQPCRR
jgi:histidinol-phosphate aminotransferase